MKNAMLLLLTSLLLGTTGCNQKNAWELVWSDEFEYHGSPDSLKWGYETGKIRNRELQYYTDEDKNVRVEDGRLVITARLEEGDSVTSASVNTLGKLDILYGRVEVSARLPIGLGTWPAIWMLGTNKGEVGWPSCGEIDIMEHVGYAPDLIHANIHNKAYNHKINTNKGSKIQVSEPWNNFNVYAVEWFEERLDFYFNDSLYFTFENDMAGNHETWPFDKAHYLLINFAFGGTWGGEEGVDLEKLPLQYEIDYVRYYKKAE